MIIFLHLVDESVMTMLLSAHSDNGLPFFVHMKKMLQSPKNNFPLSCRGPEIILTVLLRIINKNFSRFCSLYAKNTFIAQHSLGTI